MNQNKKFEKAKAFGVKFLEKRIQKWLKSSAPHNAEYYQKDLAKLNALQGFPENSGVIRGLDVRIKAKLLKAHLESEFPNSVWSVRSEFFSMGSAVDAIFKGGAPIDEAKAQRIGDLYQDDGQSDMMTDYFDQDNFVHVLIPAKVANGAPVGRVANSNILMLGAKYQ